MKNYGYQNEIDFISELDGHLYHDLNPFLKMLVQTVFETEQFDAPFTAEKYEIHAKPDIVIGLKGFRNTSA